MPAGITYLHIDTMLTGVAGGYANRNFIAKQVLDVIPSPKETGKIAKYGVEHYRIDFTERARGGNTPRIDWQPAAPVNFAGHEWTIEKPIDGRDAGLFDAPFNAQRAATFTITKKLQTKLEDLVATLMTSSGNFGSTTSGTAWGTPATGTPVTDIRAAISAIADRTGDDQVYGCCSRKIYDKLINNNEVKNLYLNTIPGAAAPNNIKPTTIAQAIGLQDLYVGPSVKLSSAEGAANTFTPLWGSSVFAVYAKSDPGMEPSPFNTGFAALIIPDIVDDGGNKVFPSGTDVVIDRYTDSRAKSEIVRGTTLYDQIGINPELGQLITGIT